MLTLALLPTGAIAHGGRLDKLGHNQKPAVSDRKGKLEMSDQNQRQARWEVLKDLILKNQESAVSLGNIALRSAILLNGGSAVALLAFVAHQWDADIGIPNNLAPVVQALSGLVAATFAAVIATGFAYLRMLFESFSLIGELNASKKSRKWAQAARAAMYLAMGLVIYSYIRFGISMFKVTDTLTPASM